MPSEKLIDLLLASLCERSDMTAEIGKLSDADWETLLRLSTTQGMAPLLYHRFSNNSPALVPEKILEDLGEIYYHNAFKNVQYYQELSDVLMHLQQGGIEVIVLKGAYLAKTIYQSQALRIIGDIDLLVKVADLEQTEKILLEMGYGYGPTERASIKAQCAKHHHLDPFVKKGAYPIEIHWTLQNQPFKITVESLWEQTRPFTVASVQVLTLSPENLLLHLCIHAVDTDLMGIRFFCDIHNTIRQDQIDWALLFHRARDWKAEKALYIALYVVKDLLATPVPQDVLERFKPSDFNLALVVNIKKFLSVKLIDHHKRLREYNFWALWMHDKPIREKLSIFLKRIFIPLESLAKLYHVPENSLRIYFYYLVHFKCLLVKHSGKVWDVLRGNKKTQTLMTQKHQVIMLKNWIKS